jgi:nucleoside-diphosphate-sugar epimerase
MPLQITDPVIPLGSQILVSGANGFIASHIVDQLLAAGYLVRGSVRNLERSSWLLDLMNTKYGAGRFELVRVEDMTKEGALSEAVRGSSFETRER